MKIVALDSSGMVASVAVIENDILLGEYTLNYKKTHSQTLLPMLDELSKMIELDLESVDAFAITSGPGSFTGLRIGAATVKGLCLATGKPLVAVPTLDALAYNMWGTNQLVCPVMDARRNQVYTGIYEFNMGKLNVIMEQKPMAVEELINRLNSLGRDTIILGDGVPVYRTRFAALSSIAYTEAPAHLNRQRAGALAVLAESYFTSEKPAVKKRVMNADEFVPEYLRLSQAERERAEKEEKNV